jgi:hypothetical protein
VVPCATTYGYAAVTCTSMVPTTAFFFDVFSLVFFPPSTLLPLHSSALPYTRCSNTTAWIYGLYKSLRTHTLASRETP